MMTPKLETLVVMIVMRAPKLKIRRAQMILMTPLTLIAQMMLKMLMTLKRKKPIVMNPLLWTLRILLKLILMKLMQMMQMGMKLKLKILMLIRKTGS